ncbi:MAG: glutamate decarboxylase [Oscillospiraceae bacterium]|nr:glutamate decarboxylase [Oscillospiraceae bacterium]
MWTVVFVSQNKPKVDKMLEVLGEKKILTMLKVSSEDDFGDGTSYEILVPKTELEMAQEIIFETEMKSK